MEKYLVQEKENSEKSSLVLSKQLFKLSLLRLVIGVMIIALILISYFNQQNWLVYICLCLLVLFIYLVYYYNKLNQQLNYYQSKTRVIKRYLDRFNQNWKNFEETGSQYVQENLEICKDLDLVGKNSLFQFLNIACSTNGKKRLLAKLLRNKLDYLQIIKEQQAVKELNDLHDFNIEIEIAGKMVKEYHLGEKAINNFLAVSKNYQIKYHHNWLNYVIPVLTIASIILFCFQVMTKLMLVMMAILVFGQLLSASIGLLKNREIFEYSAKLNSSLTYYLKVCTLVSKQDFKTDHLKAIQSDLNEALTGLKELEKISSMIKQRNNVLAFLLLNGLLLWDHRCYYRLNHWLDVFGNKLESWLFQIGELESLISLQVLMVAKENTCLPTIVDQNRPVLDFKEATHPLLNNDAVSNSFNMNHQVGIITGSNMSGKTTFLRTIGINLVLAYAGGPVMAKAFNCSLMALFTSMRIEDNIEGISTFYGELLRIKEIVEANRKGKIMIALIDEIFKGTNSVDRIIGARETIKQLSSNNIFTLITTHDFELCDLAKEGLYANYHFEEYYEDNQIKFDYKIKNGRSQTTNAQYLLKMVGIIEESN